MTRLGMQARVSLALVVVVLFGAYALANPPRFGEKVVVHLRLTWEPFYRDDPVVMTYSYIVGGQDSVDEIAHGRSWRRKVAVDPGTTVILAGTPAKPVTSTCEIVPENSRTSSVSEGPKLGGATCTLMVW